MSEVVKFDRDVDAVEALADSRVNCPTRRQKQLLTKKLTLFNRLVRSSLFQFMVGNIHWSKIASRTVNEEGKKYVNVEQALLAKVLDVILFALLLVVAPLFGLKQFSKNYWAKFACGTVCGMAFLVVMFRITLVILSQFAVA